MYYELFVSIKDIKIFNGYFSIFIHLRLKIYIYSTPFGIDVVTPDSGLYWLESSVSGE